MDSKDRSFTVEAFYKAGSKLRTSGGRYISTTPAAAAKKAFSQYYRHHKKSGRFSLEVHIRETTSGSSHKTFKYRVSKVSEHNEIKRGGETIVYNYITTVKAL
jgi:hypothetical protein